MQELGAKGPKQNAQRSLVQSQATGGIPSFEFLVALLAWTGDKAWHGLVKFAHEALPSRRR